MASRLLVPTGLVRLTSHLSRFGGAIATPSSSNLATCHGLLNATTSNVCCKARLSISHAPLTAASDAVAVETDLVISPSCLDRLNELNSGSEDPLKMLRLVVEGGGCSGFQYKFELDDKLQSDDRVFGEDSARVVVDEVSLSLVRGSTVDYHTELIRAAFRVVGNPQSEEGCSCGASFSVKI